MQQTAIAASDPYDRRHGFRIGELGGLALQAKVVPFVLQNEVHFVAAQGTEGMDKAHPGVKLGVACQAFSSPGMPMSTRPKGLRS